ncbi:hypothetical protein ACYJ2P_19915, partial [Bacillus velezensis]
MPFTSIKLNRTIIHKIVGKSAIGDAHALHSDDLHILDQDTDNTLRARIHNAVTRSKRFFETGIEHTHATSFWHYGKQLRGSSREEFINTSKAIANIAAEAHTKKQTPGGLLIVCDAEVDDK